MQEKPLLLPSARTIIVAEQSHSGWTRLVRLFAMGIGLVCVLAGAADVSSRLAKNAFGDNAAFVAFAPAATIDDQPLAATSSPGVVAPTRLRIPALGVDAHVEQVGIKADGTMGTPQNFADVSWYSLGGKPGGEGSAVFAGHVNNGLTKAGVFKDLSKIKTGDYITVADDAGRSKVYKVSSVSEYAANAATDSLFTTIGPSQLVLITCDGDWVPKAKTFDKRLVVIAKPSY